TTRDPTWDHNWDDQNWDRTGDRRTKRGKVNALNTPAAQVHALEESRPYGSAGAGLLLEGVEPAGRDDLPGGVDCLAGDGQGPLGVFGDDGGGVLGGVLAVVASPTDPVDASEDGDAALVVELGPAGVED